MSDTRRPPHGGRGLKWLITKQKRLSFARRPPHGGRGLKFVDVSHSFTAVVSSSTRGTWIEIEKTKKQVIIFLVVLHTGDVD